MICTVQVLPQPFIDQLKVQIDISVSINLVLRLNDENNNLVRMMGCQLQQGGNIIQLVNLGKFARGNYILEVRLLNGDLIHSIPLIKE